jgi:NADH dehydrogenase/NADH:ubiquinone oxidoreductase subunit G
MESEKVMIMDGQEVRFSPGETILQVARRYGIDIPTLCYLKNATPTGACRICLVEVEGSRNLVPACAAPATANMVVRGERTLSFCSPRVTTTASFKILAWTTGPTFS